MNLNGIQRAKARNGVTVSDICTLYIHIQEIKEKKS